MPVYTNGDLIKCIPRKFTSKEGEVVEYFENIIVLPEGSITINSKRDFSNHVGVPSTFTLTLRPDAQHPKLHKISLTDISPVGSDRTEKTIR